jgi:hypothetical protein
VKICASSALICVPLKIKKWDRDEQGFKGIYADILENYL